MKLFTPGPTTLPDEVRTALALPIIHHRSPQFEAIFEAVRSGITKMAGAEHTTFFGGSGTAAMEACLSGITHAQDEVVVVVGGKFGQRWQALAEAYDLKVSVAEVAWGKAAAWSDIAPLVNSQTRAVFMQACETSTGVFHAVYDIARALKRDFPKCAVVVDAITAFGIYPFHLENDGIDFLIGGSQKALMCPPGLSFACYTQEAAHMIHSRRGGYYLSFEREKQAQEKGNMANTPPISLFIGLEAALKLIENESMEKVSQRHRLLQRVCRASFRHLGFDLFNGDTDAAWGLTAVKKLPDMEVGKWLAELKQDHGIWLAGGQDQLKGHIFRFAHMGHCDLDDLFFGLSCIETNLRGHGWLKPSQTPLKDVWSDLVEKGTEDL